MAFPLLLGLALGLSCAKGSDLGDEESALSLTRTCVTRNLGKRLPAPESAPDPVDEFRHSSWFMLLKQTHPRRDDFMQIRPEDHPLQVGKSYVLSVIDGKLVIGEDVLAFGRTAKSHYLLATAASKFGMTGEINVSGAIRVNEDSVDVAGYHKLRQSGMSALLIENMIKEHFPALKVHTTAGGKVSMIVNEKPCEPFYPPILRQVANASGAKTK